jgi:hypothetical protein
VNVERRIKSRRGIEKDPLSTKIESTRQPIHESGTWEPRRRSGNSRYVLLPQFCGLRTAGGGRLVLQCDLSPRQLFTKILWHRRFDRQMAIFCDPHSNCPPRGLPVLVWTANHAAQLRCCLNGSGIHWTACSKVPINHVQFTIIVSSS